jgi:3'(2'), 5'-bisphosphate nucleotidase
LNGEGAWKEVGSEVTQLEMCKVDTEKTLSVVGSRRHGAEALEAMLNHVSETFSDINLVSMGSSLKICAIAEGSAHWYPRLALTSEWDTAAAHAVLNAAGGEIVDIDLKPLTYNQKDDILNPFFHALGDQDFDWLGLIKEASKA